MAEPADKEQLRRYPRYLVDQDITFKVFGGSKWIVGSLKNLSKGGCLLISDVNLAEGQMVELNIETISDKGSRAHSMVALIAWSGIESMGLEFISSNTR
jgi:hypothetical protein